MNALILFSLSFFFEIEEFKKRPESTLMYGKTETGWILVSNETTGFHHVTPGNIYFSLHVLPVEHTDIKVPNLRRRKI